MYNEIVNLYEKIEKEKFPFDKEAYDIKGLESKTIDTIILMKNRYENCLHLKLRDDKVEQFLNKLTEFKEEKILLHSFLTDAVSMVLFTNTSITILVTIMPPFCSPFNSNQNRKVLF